MAKHNLENTLLNVPDMKMTFMVFPSVKFLAYKLSQDFMP